MADEHDKEPNTAKPPISLSDCRYIKSPFISEVDESLLYLMQRYGVQLFYTNFINHERVTSLDIQMVRLCLPQIVQLKVRNEAHLIQIVTELDVENNKYLAINIGLDSQQPPCDDNTCTWTNLVHLVKKASELISYPIFCKLFLNVDDAKDTITNVTKLQDAGCKGVLLHGRNAVGSKHSLIHRDHWDLIRLIRATVSIAYVHVELICSSVREVNDFLEYTAVQGVAISEPLLWNPAFFSPRRVHTMQLMREYLELCTKYYTSLQVTQESLLQFSGYFLKRLADRRKHIECAQSLEEMISETCDIEEELSQLSKKQMKALGKLQLRKERFRVRSLRQKGKRIDATSDPVGNALEKANDHQLSRKERKALQIKRVLKGMESGLKIALDLSLDKGMRDKEINKLAGQVRRVYGSNIRSSHPVHLYFTGLNSDGRVYRECARQNEGFENYLVDRCEELVTDLFVSDDIVYLSPDSSNVLDRLDYNKVYVIGGLVDHAILKGLTQTRATHHGITTARLPIDEFMDRAVKSNPCYSRVLTVNQVFDIILKFHETEDWAKALGTGVPSRKGFVIK